MTEQAVPYAHESALANGSESLWFVLIANKSHTQTRNSPELSGDVLASCQYPFFVARLQ